jgi:hypothetical protein
MGNVAHMGEMTNAFQTLVVKPEVRRLLGRLRHKCEDNIKMNSKGVHCIHLGHNRDHWWALVNMVMNLHFHKG